MNDFQTSNESRGKKDFMERIRGVIGLALVLTALETIAGIWIIIDTLMHNISRFANASFVSNLIFYVIIACVFVSLLQMTIEEKPFSRTFVRCMNIIGVILCAAAILIPRLSEYHSSGLDIISVGKFVFCDGTYLTLGLLFLILARLLKTGFEMQKEMDEIL